MDRVTFDPTRACPKCDYATVSVLFKEQDHIGCPDTWRHNNAQALANVAGAAFGMDWHPTPDSTKKREEWKRWWLDRAYIKAEHFDRRCGRCGYGWVEVKESAVAEALAHA